MNTPKIEFFPTTHKYLVNGKHYPSVTTIIGQLNKGNLGYWQINKTIDYITDHILEIVDLYKLNTTDSLQKVSDIFQESKKAADTVRDDAAKYGTGVHRNIHNYCCNKPYEKEFENEVNQFIKWTLKNKISIVSSELPLASLWYQYAGTCDLVYKIGNHFVMADIKTGTPRNADMQLAAYSYAYKEMYGKEITKCVSIQINKDTKVPILKEYKNINYNFKKFLCLLSYKKLSSGGK